MLLLSSYSTHTSDQSNQLTGKELYLDDVEAHVDNMFTAGAVISGTRVALKGVAEVTTVKVMVAEVIMTATYALLDGVALVVLQVSVQLFKLYKSSNTRK